MLATQIICIFVFLISFILALTAMLGGVLKNVGITYYGFSTLFFHFVLSVFPYGLGQMCLCVAPDVWGIAYIFIAVNLLFAILPYYFLVGSLVFGKKYIYRLTPFLVPKRYSYKNVIRYRMNYSSGIVHSRYSGPKKVITYDFEIYFDDNKHSEFNVNSHDNKKIIYIKSLLEEKRCKKNGKIKK